CIFSSLPLTFTWTPFRSRNCGSAAVLPADHGGAVSDCLELVSGDHAGQVGQAPVGGHAELLDGDRLEDGPDPVGDLFGAFGALDVDHTSYEGLVPLGSARGA